MGTTQWTSFIHSWHTLGIVLKWMCISVVGIPFAILTCFLVALAASILFGLLLLTAFFACAIVCYVLIGIYRVIAEVVGFVKNRDRIHRELPVVEPRQLPLPAPPMQELRGISTARTVQRPVGRPQAFPNPFTTRRPRTPPQAHLRSLGPLSSSPRLAASLPSAVFDCQVCLEGKDRSQFPTRRITNDCSHSPIDCCCACLS